MTPNCRRCLSGYRIIETEFGSVAKACGCLLRARFRSLVPPEFRKHNLARLQPRGDVHPQQTAFVPFLKANPESSYFLTGRNRVGKSLFGWCLLRAAIIKGRRVVGCNVTALLDQYRALEKPVNPDDIAPRPLIQASDLQIGVKWFLLLQEFDKARPSEYAAERLFALVDAAHSYKHQWVITSNLDAGELIEHWNRAGGRYGASIISRLVENAVEVNMK